MGRADSNAYISKCVNIGDVKSYCNPDNNSEYSINNIASGIVGERIYYNYNITML